MIWQPILSGTIPTYFTYQNSLIQYFKSLYAVSISMYWVRFLLYHEVKYSSQSFNLYCSFIIQIAKVLHLHVSETLDAQHGHFLGRKHDVKLFMERCKMQNIKGIIYFDFTHVSQWYMHYLMHSFREWE